MYNEYGEWEEDTKTDGQIFAEALVLIIENQIKIKKHIGIAKDDGYYGDCYYDREVIEMLHEIE